MAKLSSTEKRTLETLLKLDYENSLIFTYRTLHDFLDELGIPLHDEFFQHIRNESQYDWRVPNELVRDVIPNCFPEYSNEFAGEIILKLVKYIEHEMDLETLEKANFPKKLRIKTTNIAHRLLGKPLIEYQPKTLYSDSKADLILEAEVFNAEVKKLLNDGYYAKAVEEAYKVVRGKLEELTGSQAATEAFGKTDPEKIFGYSPKKEDKDNFYHGVKSLHITIQNFRNYMAHLSSKNIEENKTMEKNLAIHYIALASLAYKLITSHKKGI